jgi:L-threonylcarbamoyladenylate synthase
VSEGRREEAASGASTEAAARFERCVRAGGVALFPSDTVYGLACDPTNSFAIERLYLLKRRPRHKPSAVMFFSLEPAFEALPEIGPGTRDALTRLLPGSVGALLPNPARRFPLACGEDPSTLGLRVPDIQALANMQVPVLQSSANRAGGQDPRSLAEVPELLRVGVDLVIDGGDLPGTPSTVVDLREYEQRGSWSLVRAGATPEQAIAEAL